MVQFNSVFWESRSIQAFGVAFIGICLMLGDSVNVKPSNLYRNETSEQKSFISDYRIYVVLFIVIASCHLILLKHIPLWEKYVNKISDAKILLSMREHTSKFLSVPDVVKYLFNWIGNISGPIGVILLILKRKYIRSAVFFLLALVYAKMSLAQIPLIILITAIIVLLLGRNPYNKRIKIYTVSAVVAVPIFLGSTVFLIWSPNSIFNYEPSQIEANSLSLPQNDPRSVLTIGDKTRLRSELYGNTKLPFLQSRCNYYLYRIFLVPIEVSSRWYQYFSGVSGEFIGLEGLTPGTRGKQYVHPSQRVGNWSYTSRFPKYYSETIHAYASIDADAYARFGTVGIVVAGVLVFLIRFGMKVLLGNTTMSPILYSLGIVMLALLLPIASLQAILIANGLFIVLLLMAADKYVIERRV
jgi:hypothetical protein